MCARVRVSEREKGFYSVLVFEVKEFAVVCVRAREKERERERGEGGGWDERERQILQGARF